MSQWQSTFFFNREKVMFHSKLSTGSTAQWHMGNMRRCQLKMRTEVIGHCAHTPTPDHPCCRGGPGYKLDGTLPPSNVGRRQASTSNIKKTSEPTWLGGRACHALGSSLLQGCHWHLPEHQMHCFLLTWQNTWLHSIIHSVIPQFSDHYLQNHLSLIWWKRVCVCALRI